MENNKLGMTTKGKCERHWTQYLGEDWVGQMERGRVRIVGEDREIIRGDFGRKSIKGNGTAAD